MQTVDLKITDVAFGGKGVARHDGKAVFVPFTIDSETVTAEITREKRKFAEAEVVDIVEPSGHRVRPECPYFGRCGGCSYQHIDYPHQLAIKWRQVRDVLQRLGKLSDLPFRPIIPSPDSYRYRNRITVHAEGGAIGFFRRDTHRLIDVERCPIAMDEVNRALAELRAARPGEGHYTLRADSSAPRVFSQANDAVAATLRELVVQMVPDRQGFLLDAYCGAGFFAKALRDKFDRVIGVDWDRFAIDAARHDATEKEIYLAGDVETGLSPGGFLSAELEKLRTAARPSLVVIADPPATGLTKGTRAALLALVPEMIVYISCNPSTLARDLAELMQKFGIVSVTPLDMFPQTAEIEVAVHLQKL